MTRYLLIFVINPYLGNRELLADIVNRYYQAKIKVIARLDFRSFHKKRYNLHPDWFVRDGNNVHINNLKKI